jgi:AraC-like DNA-binding protein
MPTTPPIEIGYEDLTASAAAGAPRGFELRRLVGASIAAPATGSPHRHEYHEIILCEQGRGMHTIDGQARDLLPGTAALIGRGRVHLMLYLDAFTGWIVRFTEEFLPPADQDVLVETLNGLFNPLGSGLTLSLPDHEADDLGKLLAMMHAEQTRPGGQRRDLVLRHLLATLLLRLDRYRTDQPGDDRRALPEYRVYQDFLIQLENGFRTYHGVGAYATALNLSPGALSRALNRAVGKTAKQLIAERIVLEAKRQLTYTTLSIKEIAELLGFRDQFRFSKVFKSQTGLPPQAFREEWQKGT